MGVVGTLEEFGRTDVAVAGGKGANLGELVRAGFAVPPGFVVTTGAYDPGGTLSEEVREAVLAAYARLGRPPVAVRSSATAEDLAEASFAGQQDTYLNIRGDDALLDAVRRCWASLFTERAVAYRAEHGVDDAGVAIAVVVQEMVDADAAGVMFTANPADGRRHETVLSAAWGLGEAVVGGLVDTDEIVVRPAEGRVAARRTADKAVMTAYADEGTTERDVPADRRREPVLDDAAAVELARLGTRVQEHFGAPQDVEWVRRDGAFLLVQSRAITVLPPPEADPPTDWTVPDPTAFYARASIVEQLPDPLTPLFADFVRTSVSRSLQALFRELVGDDVVREDDVDLPTVNGYAYYRYSRAGMARLMLHSGGAFRMLLTRGQGGTEHRWRTYAHPRYAETVRAAASDRLEEASSPALVQQVRALLDAGTEYYTAVQTIIPIAAFSESVMAWFYDRFVREPGAPSAATLMLGFDSVPIRAEKSLWDLATWARERPGLAEVVRSTPVDELVGALDGDADADEHPDLGEWRRRFAAHLETYGHLVYDLDFANAVPADEPAPLVDAVRYFLGGEGDPYVRQQALADRRDHAGIDALSGLDPVRGWAFRRLLAWAQRSAPLREDALADVGLAWPPMRSRLHELGRRLHGALEDPDDVFWLRQTELETLAAGGEVSGLDTEIEWRREEWRGRRRVTPPQLLPQGPWMVRLMGRFMPAVENAEGGDVLTGLAGSAGRVTARARVLGGPADFGALQPGEVLVAAITTPAWTSLFPRAAAVVTDIGGPLSHSSIVAREYGIPAVLGTGSATRRIRTGDLVTVDGDAGRVELGGSAQRLE